ncbi:hypothetical protein ACFQ0G_53210 [Streptomyces chiangmaiensis]|uniref:hypothetical protein n=1 Tax=Streptomyces chiangmaiensis TaxID=766497 RepID=UPI0031E9C2E4
MEKISMAQQWWTLGKQHMNEVASKNGHTLTWKRLPRESKDHALVFEGTCTDCGATVEIGRGWSSCATIRNARDEACSGPGTALLTAVEQERASELFAEAVGEYVQALEDAGVTFTRPMAPFRNPLAPEGECGLMSRDGYTCNRRLNKRGTHNLNEWSGPDHIGTHPDDDFTMPFGDDDLLLV